MKLYEIMNGDGASNGGTYALRIQVRRRVRLSFGRFRKGKMFTIEPGEYCYVGSALSEKGSTTLARRLLRSEAHLALLIALAVPLFIPGSLPLSRAWIVA